MLGHIEMIFTFDALTTKQKRSKDDERQMTKDGGMYIFVHLATCLWTF